jgi:AAA+ ATPase superfamily predicted ATPase
MFVGREYEIEKLNNMYASDKFEFAVFYGRRRVGKTTLINEFCKGKKAIYYMAIEFTEKENLNNFSKAIFEFSVPGIEMPSFTSFEKLFDYISTLSEKERIILVIDEYPYLAESYRPISSIIQAHIDMKLKDSKLFLILCGSSMSFMEYQVLGYKSPLYGRRTAQFKVKPFNYKQSEEMLSGFSKEEKAIIYGITGGIPEYLSRIDNNSDLKNNICQLFLSQSGRLFEEPSNLLKQELKDPSTYNSIILAIANGASKLNEISTKVGIETSACSNLLNSLISLGLVKKETPINEDTTRKTIYLLEDQMFRFWYRFVGPNINSIASGYGEKIYDLYILPHTNNYMGLVFEDISKQYLVLKNGKGETPFFFVNIGRWWGNNPRLKCQEEIDILSAEGDNAVFGECKWTNSLVDTDVIEKLILQSKLFHYKNNYFYIFAKSGYTDKCKEMALQNKSIYLVSFDDM